MLNGDEADRSDNIGQADLKNENIKLKMELENCRIRYDGLEEKLRLSEQKMMLFDRMNMAVQMAAGIGHELRNPMAAIRGLLQVLKDKPGCDIYKESFNLMIDELDRANSIISEFLSLSKDKPVNMRMGNLNYIIKRVSPLIMSDARGSGKNIRLELGDIPDILLNECEIRQLIFNMVRNGLEAMDVEKSMTISTYRQGDSVVVAFSDEGHGISEDVLGKIGTPFFTTKENGTGIGLTICYKIAEHHHADIKIDTGANGTTFYILFPQAESV